MRYDVDWIERWSNAYTDDALLGAISYYKSLPQDADPPTIGLLEIGELLIILDFKEEITLFHRN